MYSIIDIKTTTASVHNARLLYVKIVEYNQQLKIKNRFESFVNPEVEMTSYMIQFSGIRQSEVKKAPKFFEIAKKIIEVTKGQILLGHQMNFVYQVIKRAFKELGFSYTEKNLDIEKVMKYYEFYLSTQLTVFNTFEQLIHNEKETILLLGTEKEIYQKIRKPIHADIVNNLPEKTGVYYFKNAKNKLIYVGKSVNIKKRVQSHLSNQQTKKAMDMKGEIHKINYKVTGSELVALLLESDDIKKYKPRFNRAQKRTKFNYGLFETESERGYKYFTVEQNPHEVPVTTFTSFHNGQNFFAEKMTEYDLCQCLSNLYTNSSHTCFLYQINKCKGAAMGKETVKDYNKKAQKLINHIRYKYKEFFIVDQGRKSGENTIIHIKDYQYQGWGYCQTKDLQDISKLLSCVNSYKNNKDIELIIQGYLETHKVQKIIINAS